MSMILGATVLSDISYYEDRSPCLGVVCEIDETREYHEYYKIMWQDDTWEWCDELTLEDFICNYEDFMKENKNG